MPGTCDHCIKGSIHAGLPKGKEETVHGVNAYVVGNKDTAKAIIVVYSDIFGLKLPNNKLIADAYAASGDFLVYLPDFFAGDPVKLKFADVAIPVDASKQSSLAKYSGLLASMPSLLLWFARHKEEPTWQYCQKFLIALRQDTFGKYKIGMSGFCFGGRYAIRAGQSSSNIRIGDQLVPLVDAVVALHPSNLELPRDVNNPSASVPLSIAWGEEDEMVSFKQKSQIEYIFRKLSMDGASLPEVEHRTYKPGRHGFAVRGNPENPVERSILEDTEKQAVDWFRRWL